MSKESDRRARGLSKDENELWEVVTRGIAPLKKRAKRTVASEANPADGPTIPAAPRKAVVVPQRASFKPEPKKPPPLAPLDRKTRQKIARGKREIGGRLDLHGYTQDQAHIALLRFLRDAQAKGTSVVLVITGKGASGDGNRGVLRRAVPIWLGLPEFREYVIGFDDAAISHGGQGAIYVRIRRARHA